MKRISLSALITAGIVAATVQVLLGSKIAPQTELEGDRPELRYKQSLALAFLKSSLCESSGAES